MNVVRLKVELDLIELEELEVAFIREQACVALVRRFKIRLSIKFGLARQKPTVECCKVTRKGVGFHDLWVGVTNTHAR